MKKYLLILLGILMAILYQHPASVLAEEAQKITVSYQYIDEDTGEIFREEKRNKEKHMKPHRDGKKSMVLKKRKWYKNE